MKNNNPDLLDILARYGRHDRDCVLHRESNLPNDPRCTCGFSQAQVNAQTQHSETMQSVMVLRESLRDMESITSLVHDFMEKHGYVSPSKWYSLGVNIVAARTALALSDQTAPIA